jgi:hypothetical protein
MSKNIWQGIAFAQLILVGCSSNPPYHSGLMSEHELAAQSTECGKIYTDIDNATRELRPMSEASNALTPQEANIKSQAVLKNISDMIAVSRDTPDGAVCWKSSWEHHVDYDLFFTEFDDEGWAADTREQSAPEQTQLDLLFSQLNQLAKAGPLDIVIFTHGWHGSSKPDDWYPEEFRGMLQSLAGLEENPDSRVTATAFSDASRQATSNQPLISRRVVGIFVGWRGDSTMFPSDKVSVWDRKLAAETVSIGAVQGLFARMHKFYLENSCHLSRGKVQAGNPDKCGHVRMLTIGHSFGGLIDFRSLVSDMETGLDADKPTDRAYSFGDLVVLLNPAFEGTRYRPLFFDAVRRGTYIGADLNSEPPAGAQLPVLLTLQSEGDTATGDWFPLFRRVTTTFDNPKGPAEQLDNVRAVGWIDDFATHRLCFQPSASPGTQRRSSDSATDRCPDIGELAGDTCDSERPHNYACRVNTWATQKYNQVGPQPLYLGGYSTGSMWMLPLKQKNGSPLPAYFPYWMVQVDKSIMSDHDDIWNSGVNDVILQFYWAVVQQADQQVQSYRSSQAAQLDTSAKK